MMDSQTFLLAGLSVVGVIVWLVRLEGRVNVTDVQYAEIIRRLDRIEQKQDANP